MKIRLKIALITIFIGMLIVIFGSILTNNIILRGFIAVEDSDMIQNVNRVNNVLLTKMYSIDATTVDYAVWDASYYAITGENTRFSEVDIGEGTLERIDMDFVILIRNDGKIVFTRDMFSGVEADYDSISTTPDAKILYSYIEEHYASIICPDESVTFNGLIKLPLGIAMISSRPILKSDGTGPVIGTIMFGKIVDASFIETVSAQAHLSVSFQPYDSVSNSDKSGLNMLFNNDGAAVVNVTAMPIQIIHIDENTASGNTLLEDIYAKPVALLKVTAPRTIYLEGKNAVKYTLRAIIWVTILFIFAGYFLFNKFIISRLVSMEHQMRDIQAKKLTSSRIIITGKDELSSFGQSVNDALDVIEKAIEEKQAVFDADPDTYFYVDFSWKIIDYKLTETLAEIVAQKKLTKLRTLSLSNIFNSAIISKLSKARLESIKSRKPVILDFDISVSGSYKVFEARVVATNNNNNNNNNNNMFLILLRDITDRKTFEHQLLEKNKDLEKFNKFAVDRELRMSDLKKEMRDLKNNTENNTEK